MLPRHGAALWLLSLLPAAVRGQTQWVQPGISTVEYGPLGLAAIQQFDVAFPPFVPTTYGNCTPTAPGSKQFYCYSSPGSYLPYQCSIFAAGLVRLQLCYSTKLEPAPTVTQADVRGEVKNMGTLDLCGLQVRCKLLCAKGTDPTYHPYNTTHHYTTIHQSYKSAKPLKTIRSHPNRGRW
jgi:hypothetical protein